jgi:hypothetical protein
VTAREIFEQLAPLVAPLLEQEFGRRDLCILATRVAIETAAYFGVEAVPVPVQVILYNEAFARHVADGFAGVDINNVASWGDGSWSVGVKTSAPESSGRWNGHLIAVADGCFGDFSIQQAARPQHGIHTGPALIGPYAGECRWKAMNDAGTTVEYQQIADGRWRNAPDWKNAASRRPLVGKLIRALRAMEVCQ